MENEQLEKRIKWLDDERRKDKAIISELGDRLEELEAKLDTASRKQTEFDSDITRLRTSITRVDDFDNGLADFRLERKKELKDFEKLTKSWINDAKKNLRAQIQGIEAGQKSLVEDYKQVKDLDKKMTTRIEEETRFNAVLREMEKDVGDIDQQYKEYIRYSRSAKEERLKEVKRITDLQGEQTALRKRVDEMRGLMDLVNSDNQKIKNRIQELESIRRDLKKEQDSFLESAVLQNTERESTWKNWMTRFDSIEKQALDLDEQMTKLDSTHRGAKRMQDELKIFRHCWIDELMKSLKCSVWQMNASARNGELSPQMIKSAGQITPSLKKSNPRSLNVNIRKGKRGFLSWKMVCRKLKINWDNSALIPKPSFKVYWV